MELVLKVALAILQLGVILGIFGWFMVRALRRSHNPASLVVKWVLTLIVLGVLVTFAAGARDPLTKVFAVFFGAFCGLVLAVIWAPSFCEMVSRPFTALYDGGDVESEARPFYSKAEARRKRGLYREAIAEIQTQLIRFPGDFQGRMMLAEIHAEDLKDVAAARETVEELLTFEGLHPQNVVYALNRLADWALKFDKDLDRARMALERIVYLLPDTPQSHQAQQRIARLTPEQTALVTQRPKIEVKRLTSYEDLRDRVAPATAADPSPESVAAEYVSQLEVHPNDHDTREKLAVLYAEHYHRLDLALEQLEQLIAAPGQPQRHVARWLNLAADLQIRFGTDPMNEARATLQRIVELFPGSAVAATADNRIGRLGIELRGRRPGHFVQLGKYDENIGLNRA